MNKFFQRASIKQLQWLVWISVALLFFVSILPVDGAGEAAEVSILSTSFYAVIIYSNISLLYPRLYLKGRRLEYGICVFVLLVIVGFLRSYASWWFWDHLFKMPGETEDYSFRLLLNGTIAAMLALLLSFIFRIAIAYFSLKREAEKIRMQKSQAELNLLKSQVQPHFLFNTLNNIYYEAYRESPRTALLIERLSDVMRYFVDESPKELVQLSAETRFLENYMALEKIRIRYGVDIDFGREDEPEALVPPMLLMPFVENIFKHGIDRFGEENKIRLSLRKQDGFLRFETWNRLPSVPETPTESGFGLRNLRHRLQLLYGTNFELEARQEEGMYHAYLKIPLS